MRAGRMVTSFPVNDKWYNKLSVDANSYSLHIKSLCCSTIILTPKGGRESIKSNFWDVNSKSFIPTCIISTFWYSANISFNTSKYNIWVVVIRYAQFLFLSTISFRVEENFSPSLINTFEMLSHTLSSNKFPTELGICIGPNLPVSILSMSIQSNPIELTVW